MDGEKYDDKDDEKTPPVQSHVSETATHIRADLGQQITKVKCFLKPR
jgi:hypothetical protein